MIQIKRGNTSNWRLQTSKLASGQPGYDKNKHKIKIGDGENLWKDLPYASGLFDYEILNSEETAKTRKTADAEDGTVITYGTDVPDKDTVGKLYLQYYDTEPETDYVVEYGVDGIWTYQKWHSGIARCWCILKVDTEVQEAFEGVALYSNNKKVGTTSYPIEFVDTPVETATLQRSGGVCWLANSKNNTKDKSGEYSIISIDKLPGASYNIALQIEGFFR